MTHARPTIVLAALLATACEQPLAPPLDSLAPGRVTLSIVANTLATPFGDAHIRNEFPNRQLEAPGLNVRTTGEGIWRVLVSWKQDSIAAVVGPNAVDSAFLEFEVIDVTGEVGGYVGLHRATQEWGEDEVTWNCANDPINNLELDCDAADLWDMTNPAQWPFVSAPTDSAFVTESTSGFVRFDVTSDVQAFVSGSAQNYGWVLKRTDESQAGFVWLYDKDSPPPPAGPGAPPKLILHLASQDTTRPPITATSIPQPHLTISNGQETYYRNIVALQFHDSTSGPSVQGFLSKYDAVIVGGVGGISVYFLQIPDPGPTFQALDSVIADMRSEPGVVRVARFLASAEIPISSRFPGDSTSYGADRASWFDPNPNDYIRPRSAIRAPLAWGCETGLYDGAERVKVALIDFLFGTHDLSASSVRKIAPLATNLEPDGINNIPSKMNHGSGVVSTLAATGDNGTGIAGMIWGADLQLHEMSVSTGPSSMSTYAIWPWMEALDSARVHETHIVASAMHLGRVFDKDSVFQASLVEWVILQLETYLSAGPKNLYVQSLNNRQQNHTISFLRTGGTPGDSLTIMEVGLALFIDSVIPTNPALRNQLILVIATDALGQRASFADVWASEVDIGAPGVDIGMLDRNGQFYTDNGSSFAVPFVAGVAAQLRAMDSSLTAAEVKDYILRGARDSVMDPSTGVKTAKQPLAGLPGVYQLDAYAPLRLLSAERSGSPICGYEVRLEDNEIVFEKPSGQIVKPFPGPGQSENTSRGGISVAQGGRLIAVSANFTGQPGGEGVLVLNQTAGFVAQIPGPFYRQYLERDTVDVFVSPTADSSFPDPGRLVITRGRTGVVHDFDLLAITSPDPQTQGTRIARIDVAPSGQYAAIQGLYFGTLPDAGPRVYIVPLVPGAPAIQVGNRDRTPSAPCQNSLTGALGPLWSHDSRRLSTAFSTLTRNAPQTLPMWINTCTVWSTFNLLSDSGSVVFAADTGSVAFQGTAIFAHRLTGDDRFMITTEMNVGGFNNSPLGPCDIVLRNALTPELFSLTLRPGAPNECNATLKTVPVISNTVAPEVVSPAKPSDREF